ncbi:hypothetical protein ACOMHN_049250 [Nucella lapillus]
MAALGDNITRGSSFAEGVSPMDLLVDLTTTDGSLPESRPWDNSDPFFSASTRDLLQKILKCYVRQMIVFVGIPGNVLCCVVFFKQGLGDRIRLLLFWLAVADLTNLTLQLLFMPGCYLLDHVQINNWSTIVTGKLGFLNWWVSHASGILIVVVSVDRCLSVALPLKAKILLNYRTMVAAIVMSFLLSLTYFLPSFFAYTVKWRMDPSTNRSMAYIVDTDWFPVNRNAAVSIWSQASLIFRPVLLILMVIFCTITVVCLKRASRHRQELAGARTAEGESKDSRITQMLLFLCFIYIVLLLPEICNIFAAHLFPEFFAFRKYHNTHIVVYQFLWIASCLNSTVNFYIYVLLSSRFQKTLKELCFCFGYKG